MRSRLGLVVIALVIVVLAIGGWFLFRRGGLGSPKITQTAQIGDMRVTMQLDDAEIGPRVIDVLVADASDNPVDGCDVRLHFAMVEMDMGTIDTAMSQLGRGHFQTKGQFFSMIGRWNIVARVTCAGQPEQQASFAFPIAAPGEVAGPLNPLTSDPLTIDAGKRLYLENCAACHGVSGRGDGPNAAGLNPRPANFTQHMIVGQHTDGQIYFWIRDGFPGSAMPAWRDHFTEEQIWQLVIFLRTFGQGSSTPTAPSDAPTATPAAGVMQPAQIPVSSEPLPPLVFARYSNIWRSEGGQTQPRPITNFSSDSYAQYPTLSPDGTQLAFIVVTQPAITATMPLPTSALYVAHADGSGARLVWKPASGLLGLPSWSADGQALYLGANGVNLGTGSERQLEILRVDLATGTPAHVLDDVLDPALSKDGTQLAYARLSKDGYTMSLEIAAPDGSGARTVLDGKDFQGFYAPRFSPDGTYLIVAAIGGPATDAQGKPIAQAVPTLWDSLLALVAPASAEAHGLPWDLWMVRSDGSGLRRLTWFYEDMPMAAFSPDGAQVAVMAANGVYLMSPDGGQLRRIDPQGDHHGVDWGQR